MTSIQEHFGKWFNKHYEICGSKHSIKKIDKCEYNSPVQVINRYNTAMKEAMLDTIPDEAGIEVINFIIKKTVEREKESKYKPKITIDGAGRAGSWLYEILMCDPKCCLEISNRGDQITFVKNGCRVAADEKTVLSYAMLKAKDNPEIGGEFNKELIKAGWEMLSKNFVANCMSGLQQQVKFDTSVDKAILDRFLKYLYNYLDIEQDYDIYEMLFKHWMWYLKRRIFGKKVRWHIWLNFMGEQGIGKTEIIMRMLKFMQQFVTEADLSAIEDINREIKKFTDYFVIFFDELKQGANTDGAELQLKDSVVDMIKGIMTQEVFTVRTLGTQTQNKFVNTFAPISCANKHLYDIIYDGEAMRRWFEFTCRRKTIPTNYDELNSVLETFPEVLKCIDEDNDNGYWVKGSAVDNKIVAIQKGYIPTNTSTNDWINKCNIVPDNTRNPKNKFTITVYSHYRDYCKSVGKFSASMSRVEMIMRRMWPDACDENYVYLKETQAVDPSTGSMIFTEYEEQPSFDDIVKSDDINNFEL